MPRTRNAITISLDTATLTIIDDAATLHGGNRSAAIKAFIHGDIVKSDAPVQAGAHWVEVSEAGHAVLSRYAAAHNLSHAAALWDAIRSGLVE